MKKGSYDDLWKLVLLFIAAGFSISAEFGDVITENLEASGYNILVHKE